MPTRAELDADDFDGSVSVSEWLAQQKLQRRKSTSPGRSMRSFLLAASVAVATVTAIYFSQTGLKREQAEAYATPVARQQEVKLVDGSTITLGARTQIQTRITAQERVIVLDRGEAWFKVARDRTRPFRVLAGNGVITALGTEFNVRHERITNVDQVTVTVGSGAVSVEPRGTASTSSGAPDQGNAASIRKEWKIAKLEKGQEVTYGGTNTPRRVTRADIEVAAAWKEGRLEYIHQPLSTVVARVNRYSAKPIVLADETVGAIDFSGTVFEGQIPEWIRALQKAFPIVVDENEERIAIRAR